MSVKNKVSAEAFSCLRRPQLTIGIKCPEVAFRLHNFSVVVLFFFFFVSFL
jgi:hypothetical protein